MTHTTEKNWEWARRLEKIGLAVRGRLIAARRAGEAMSTAVAQEGGDTIFAIDRHVEPVIEREIEAWPPEDKPVLLVAEGMGEDGRRVFGDAQAKLKYRLIIDPIDGTRNVMYDKRSAWFIAAIATDRGEATRLSDSFASVMVELPYSKQTLADSFLAVQGGPVRALRQDVTSGHTSLLAVRPSDAGTLKHGFGQVANFFPGTKVLASELMEEIVRGTLGEVEPGSAAVFDDQYMTTAGQMIEIMTGHDRFCCDLRPLFYAVLEKQGKWPKGARGLECHPYDCAGLLAAKRAGVVITDGFGRELDAPMDVHSPVHWCGYANEALRRAIEPVILGFFKIRGLTPAAVKDNG
ncbi:MAG: hypothetical protein IT442_09485 [Phycisphaeraceae bacterium]|nr:hypothetical protein [Phycisphaeraceae bacterium]